MTLSRSELPNNTMVTRMHAYTRHKPVMTGRFLLLLCIFLVVLFGMLFVVWRSMTFHTHDLERVLQDKTNLPPPLVAGTHTMLTRDDAALYDVAGERSLFTQDGAEIGSMRVYLLSRLDQRDRLFEFLSLMESQEGIVPFVSPQIGEEMVAAQATTLAGNRMIHLTFTRCHAVADGWFQWAQTTSQVAEAVIAYAQQLDTRLTAVACR